MDWFLYDIDLCRERVKQSTNQLKFIILKFYDRDLQSFITDYNKSLLSHSAECNMENIFRVSHEPLGEWNNSKIWETRQIFANIALVKVQ